MQNIQRYNKAIVAVVGVGLTLIYDSYGAQMGLPADWPQIVLGALTPILVYAWPNKE